MSKHLILICILAVSGCATKQYPISSPVSFDESSSMDCKSVQQEIARTKSVQQEIERIGDFDGRTVLGVLGDLGVGNGMAKSEARKKAQSRLSQLEQLQASKCNQS